jgi:succinate dehydrogenase flavin-adding protein (antitoxin of CptAB toxin-antitoxin module)
MRARVASRQSSRLRVRWSVERGLLALDALLAFGFECFSTELGFGDFIFS